MEVVEHEHERLGRRQPLEQLAHRAVAAVALVLERRPPAASRTEPARERRARARCERRRRAPRGDAAVAREVLVERVDEHPERQVRSSSDADPRARGAARVGASGELREEARLADPRLAHQRERSGPPASSSARASSSDAAGLGAPNEVLGYRDHSPSGEHRSGSGSKIRVLPRCRPGQRGGRLGPMSRYLLHHRHEAHECGVVFAAVQRAQEPASAPGDARLVPLRRTRDLVDGGRRIRAERRAAPALRRRAHHRPKQKSQTPTRQTKQPKKTKKHQ